MSKTKEYNIEHKTVNKPLRIFEDQESWIKRNQPPEFKSESEFIRYLISLGIQAHQSVKIREIDVTKKRANPCKLLSV